jgi:hypothetical protein
MKSLVAPMLATASFATFLVCGMVAACSLSPSYGPHKFRNLGAGIWTSGAVRIDRSAQSYERVTAVEPSTASNQKFTLRDPMNDHSVDVADAAVGSNTDAEPASALASNDLCNRAGDNSHQPFDGGPRRQCDAALSKPDHSADTVAENPSQDHGAWCQSRYSSYNPSDDTYQPLGGGKRKFCTSPPAVGISG